MSREDWICVVLMILGVFLFLYGANYYDNVVGWAGVYLFVIGFFGLVILAIYRELSKVKPEVESEAVVEAPQNP